MSNLSERKLAKLEGRVRYFTGIPCKYGHIEERLVSNGVCIACTRIQNNKRRIENLEKAREKDRNAYARNRETKIKKAAEYRNRNPEKVKSSIRKWQQNNRPKRTADENARRALKLKATPLWLSEDQKSLMIEYYETASNLRQISGNMFAVDHIIPLKGKNVTGLNVPWNLRIISQSENSKKGNRIDNSIKLKPHTHILISGEALPWNWKQKGIENVK